MAKKARTKGRTNARLQTNFKAETQAGKEPAGDADTGTAAKPAETTAATETNQPVGGAAPGGTAEGSGAAGGAVENGGADGSGAVRAGNVAGGVNGNVDTQQDDGQQGAAASGLGNSDGAPAGDTLSPDAGTGQGSDAPAGSAGSGENAAFLAALARVGNARLAAMRAYVGVAMQLETGVPDTPYVFEEAAAFVLADRSAPSEAIPIHLALQKLGGSMKPSPVDVMLWGVFRSTLLAVHDHLLAIEVPPVAGEVAPAGGMPLDRAMQPQPGPFDPAGFTPRV